MAEIKIMTFEGLSRYDEKMKAFLAAADAEVLAAAKAHAEGLADNYDAAGTAATKVQELAEGAVADNAAAIAKLNGNASTEGSVAKAIADAKALIDADVDGVEAKADANAGEITGLKGRMDAVESKAQGNADEITGLKGRMDTAEDDIAAIEEDIGNVDELETTNKDIVAAINEVRNSVSAGGVSSAVTMTSATTTDGMLKSYTIKQGENVVGTIDIPKDMVVESGSVVNLAEGEVTGYAAGTYIKLVLANVAEPLYINVGTLVDIYTAQANAAQVQINIDSATRVISATIVAGSIGSTELADNAVVTAKIADKNVTKAKLSTEVQASLDKADAAAPQTALDAEVERATAAEAKALTDAKAYADGIVATEKARAEGIEAGLESRLAAAEAKLGSGEGSVESLIATAKSEAIAAAAADAASKDAQVLVDAKAYADGKAADNKALIDANAGDITALKGRMDTAEGDIDKLEASLAEGGATALAIAAAKKAGDDAQADVDALTDRVAANEGNISAHADRLTALENKVGDGFVAITNAEIDSLF